MEPTPPVAPVFDEALLVLWGPIGWHARVRLLPDRIEAEPTSALERLAGAAPFSIPLGPDVEWTSNLHSGALTITAADQQRKFTGKATARLHALLMGMRAPMRVDSAPDTLLLTGPVHRIGASGRRQSCELRLGTNSLQVWVQTTGGASAESVRLPLAELSAIERQTDADQLRLYSTRGDELHLQGELVGGLYVCLRAMGFEGNRQPDPIRAPLWFGQATQQTGTLPRGGTLAIGPGGLFFVDQTLGASLNPEPYLQLGLGALLSFELSTARAPVLSITRRTGEPLRFALGRRGLNLDDLAKLMLEHGASISSAWGGVLDRPVDARLLLTPAGLERLVADCEAQIEVGRPLEGACCLLHDGQVLHRGWLALLTTGVLFAPADERPEARLFIDRTRFDPARSSLEGERTLRLVEGHRTRLAYMPQSAPLVAELWRIIGDAKPGVAALRSRFPHLERMTGTADQVRVADHDVELLSARGAVVTIDDEGLSISVSEAPPALLSAGLRVRVEFNIQKTVFSFKSLLVRVERSAGAGARLVLSAPEAVDERENSRHAFRVGFVGQGQVTLLRALADRRSAGPTQSADLADLSFTGVGLRLPKEATHPVRAVVRLRLPLGGRSSDELLAEVVHTRDFPDGTVHHGLRFLDPTAALHRDLQSKVVRLQQDEVVRKREEAEASRTGQPQPPPRADDPSGGRS